MTKEWQLVESRRDSSHEFQGDLACTVCGKPRWNHLFDGFKPGNPPSSLSWEPQSVYRGPHPAWSRPGSFSKLERSELEAEQRVERQKIERAIEQDKARFRAGKRQTA